jgi:EAL and modified HD-GYP domain-containing signal transduction protein
MHPNLFWMARQPILDRRGTTVAYELLFREGTENSSRPDDRTATANVIARAFNDLGAGSVLGSCPGFINFDAELLFSDIAELLPAGATVIELLETITLNDQVVDRCRELRSRGFSFALDDITELDESHASILPLVDFVKIDIQALAPGALQPLIAQVRNVSRARLLAEKVEDQVQAETCLQLGFDLFQGFYFARPTLLSGRRVDPARMAIMRLLNECASDDWDLGPLEAGLKETPELAYKLMRLVNSVGMGVGRRIGSLSHALVVVGRRQLRRWLQVLMFACDDQTRFAGPLLQMATARGKLLELLAQRQSADAAFADRAFMTGILSLLDALLEVPMDEVIAQMTLADDVALALVERSGRLGRLLQVAEALERSDLSNIAPLVDSEIGCSMGELLEQQIAALTWSNAILRD